MLNLQLILFAGCWGLLLSEEQVEWNNFLEYVSTYNKEYRDDSSELANRFKIFKESLKRQEYLNSLEGSTVYGVNEFSDLTVEEFKDQYLSGLLPSEVLPTKAKESKDKSIPQRFDWRDLGKVSSIKDQQKCGSCWAFSISEGLESRYAIQSNKSVVSLSTQQFISCDKCKTCYGCDGGTLGGAVGWLITNKVVIVPDSDYPFSSGDGSQGTCRTDLPNQGVQLVASSMHDYINNERGMAAQLSSVSPLSVTVNANIWQDYRGGIIRYHCTNTSIDHAVQIVGYDMTSDPPYWIVRNTWGTKWGVNGYLYIAMNKNLCGKHQL